MKKILSLIFVFVITLAPSSAFAGIAFVSTSTTVNPASNTVSYDATATNGYLVVQTLKQSSQTVTGVTYNGVAMTQLTTVPGPDAGERLYLWGLGNPTTGTNDIVVSDSGAGTLVVDVALYSGSQQVSSVEATNTVEGITDTSATISVTTLTDNAWLVGYFRGNGTGAFTAGSGTVVRTAGSEGTRQLADSANDRTPPGAFSLNVTMNSQDWSAMAFSLQPVSTALGSHPYTYALWW